MQKKHRWRVILAFALVYVFWGSTYLGIRVAIEHVPPLLMTGVRFSVAGSLMLAYCAWAGRGVRLSALQTARVAVIGILLLSIANVVLAWAEETVPTGLAALIVSVVPLWFLVLETWVFHGPRTSSKGHIGLLLGIGGIAVLLWPKLTATSALGHKQFFAAVCLIGSSFVWSLGSALSKRWQTGIDPFTASGWEMLFAGILNIGLGLLTGAHHHAHWTASGLGAIAYLIVCGSWVGFSAYIWLLQNVPMSKVATYAYINPVVAVFLGWLVLRERIDGYIWFGSVIVISAVALVTSAEIKPRPGVEERLPAVESAGD